MDTYDFVLLILSGLLGFVLSLFIQPLLEDRVQGILVRTISRFWFRPKESLAGEWCAVMLKDGVTLSRNSEITNIKLSEVRNRVAGTFKWKDRTYRILAKRHNNQYLTGTYEDIIAGHTFEGSFQLRIYPNEQVMEGRWIGFNSANQIIEGPWEWRRSDHNLYPFEN